MAGRQAATVKTALFGHMAISMPGHVESIWRTFIRSVAIRTECYFSPQANSCMVRPGGPKNALRGEGARMKGEHTLSIVTQVVREFAL